MNCAAWEETIAQYAGGDLAAPEVRDVEEHLRSCAGCAEFARALEGDRELLHARPAEFGDVDFDGMRRELRGRIVREPQLRRWVPAVAVAAALLIAVVLTPRHGKPPAAIAPVQIAEVRPAIPEVRPVLTIRRPRPRGRIHTAQVPAVEMRITTADPDVIIILVPTTTEIPHE